jgi:Na+-transporting NADH:ubiquinone oxidoreductase subunit A
MASFIIKKGFDIKLAGRPEPSLVDAGASDLVTVHPREFGGTKPRLNVREGDTVKRGTVLFHDKSSPGLQFCSPASGKIQSIVLGPRRVLDKIVIQADRNDSAEIYKRYPTSQLASLPRDEVVHHLAATGLIALIKQRPFSRIPSQRAGPKSIFVNAMNTAPFHPDLAVVLKGNELAFQAGLDVLKTLTKGAVHLCLDGRLSNASPLTGAKNVTIHTFSGPHPSGNTSVHIHHIDPIRPGDVVWTIKAADVIPIGHLFMEGEIPATRIISLAGPGVKEGARKHYRVRVGSPLKDVLGDKLLDGEQRIIGGDVLAGSATTLDGSVRFFDDGYTVIPEDRERHLVGWMMPGLNSYSTSRTFLSTWLKRGRDWALGTNQHGELRPMVLTGLYDRYLPMNILPDFLMRAVLANDVEEAVALGLLETDPEDFALCAFACPSKMDLCGIIRRGLDLVEKEGV